MLRVAADSCAVERLSRTGVAELAEVPTAFGKRGHCASLRFALAVAKSLVVSKEESLILDDGSAERSAELVLLERLGLSGEVIRRVERVVAEEFPQSAVIVVGA